MAGSEVALVSQWLEAGEVVTTGGERLRVLYRGRRHGDGPDFKGAVVATPEGALLCGDVELHTTSGCWQQHGHQHNPAYNNVILHVVIDDDGHATVRADGQPVPLAMISSQGKPVDDDGAPCIDALARLGSEALGARLDAAGEQRFLAKSAAFEVAVAMVGAEQALYCGLMRALGYGRNGDAFGELASRLPWAVLRGFLAGKARPAAEAMATTILVGMAGLLPAADGLWASLHLDAVLAGHCWHRSGLRPCNLPERRLRGAAILAVRYRDSGLVDGLLGLLSGPVAGVAQRVQGGLLVATAEGPALVGRGRAADIAVNVVLPFGHAWGQAMAAAALAQRARAAYNVHGPTGDNAVLAHMRRQIGLGAASVATAQRQQGLLHLHFGYCTQGRCRLCPLC